MIFMSISDRHMSLIRTLFFVTLSTLLLTGCRNGSARKDYTPPSPDVPDQWTNEIASEFLAGSQNISHWWESFDEPYLNELLDKAFEHNYDIRLAMSRVRQARVIRAITAGEKKLNIDASGYYMRTRPSEFGFSNLPTATGDQYNLHNIGLDASWEIDVFGRIEQSIEAADADYQASIEDLYDVQAMLTSEITSNYIYIRTLEQRLEYARENVRIQESTLELTNNRYDAQLVPRMDVEQSKLNLSRTQAVIPLLEMQISQAIYAMNTLLGDISFDIAEDIRSGKLLEAPAAAVNISMPADAVRRRPDVRRTERMLYAQSMRVGVAQAELYPQFSLSGSFAFEGTQLKHLGNRGSRTWSWGPSMNWSLFNGDRLRNNVLLQKERTEELLLEYKQIVLGALEEVESALIAYDKHRERKRILLRSVDAAGESVELARELYKSGLTDFQNVLDAEQSLFEQQDQYALSSGDLLQSLVSLYRATGGGWKPFNADGQMQTDTD
jgi:outer membrane protein, multidrug efflux system